ncbi:fungal-specific transcription factor domain-containing protein [Aspergillus pseudotamarii]|uniref:Fungal-specific transcription factor domain-containing protein n=1 Tax=Aspergillus pseudotamarii TaxID=132259 RepID=A0A5N6TAS2_ASPPS|nr:fungal-specific transcription factor domain-containing protein [Aspergillus pseudotamarii]KAE8143478.1 fungal-specific transcription factor domain-containing protein [Aspergillus pseudotamarii]
MDNRRTAILSHIFPEVMESSLILHCVLMIAAKDLLKYDSSVELQASAVEYYDRAVSGLREALSGEQSANEPTSDHNLLAVALFCLHEILPHLNAAAALLRPRLQMVPPNSSLRKFLIEMFCYFFSITAFTHGAHLSLCEARQIFEFPGLLEHLESGSIMGTSQKVFFIVFRVALHLSRGEPTTFSDRRIYRDIVSAEQDLRSVRASFHARPDMGAQTINDGVTFELYRLACLIYLQSLIDQSISICGPSIQEMVSSFVSHLSMLPPESPSDGFLCWPMVIVGRCAIQQEHRAAITTKLKTIFNKFRSEIFSRNLAVLRQHWRYLERVDPNSAPTFSLAHSMHNFNDAVLMV